MLTLVNIRIELNCGHPAGIGELFSVGKKSSVRSMVRVSRGKQCIFPGRGDTGFAHHTQLLRESCEIT